MIIRWLGHACFSMTSESGFTVVTDPYSAKVGYPCVPVEADVVTISHEHYDHNNRDWVGGNPVYLDTPGAHAVGGVNIEGITTFHDEVQGKKRGNNTVFCFQIDGLRVCHLGDLGHTPELTALRRIGSVDVLMVPVGGTYTLDAAQAKALVEVMRPKVTLPMHYRTALLSEDIRDITPLEAFLALFDTPPVRQETLVVSAMNIQSAPRMVVLPCPGYGEGERGE